MVVCFVDIGGIVDHHCLNFIFIMIMWFSPGTPVSSINKTDRHDITEILLKVALSQTIIIIDPFLSKYSNGIYF